VCTSESGDRVLICPLETDGVELIHTFNGCYVWDLNRSKILFDGRALGGGVARATSLGSCNHRVPKLSSDGRYLFEAVPPQKGHGEVEDEVVVWDLASSRVHLRLKVRGALRATAPHPDGMICTLAADERRLYLQSWSPTDGECLSTRDLMAIPTAQGGDASRDTAGDYDLGFTPNGRFAVILLMPDGIPISSWRYDLKTGRMHPRASAVTPDGRYSLSLESRKRSLPEFARTKSLETKHWTLEATDVANQIVTAIPVTLGNRDDQVQVRWSVDGQTMFTANVDSTLTCWDARTGQERVTFQTGLQRITRMEVSPRGDAVALADEQGGVAVLRASLPTDLTDRSLLGRSGSEP
jgi:WD40 repeat protein